MEVGAEGSSLRLPDGRESLVWAVGGGGKSGGGGGCSWWKVRSGSGKSDACFLLHLRRGFYVILEGVGDLRGLKFVIRVVT